MSEHHPHAKFSDECVCGHTWPCPIDLQAQLRDAQESARVWGDYALALEEVLRGELEGDSEHEELHTTECLREGAQGNAENTHCARIRELLGEKPR